jgi:phosphoribosylformimino-5-aminoimidazole carboxamide ribotide isomerase
VNLDGAFEQSEQANSPGLKAILGAAREFTPAGLVQFGGGLRTLESVERALEAGVQRVVLGTAIVQTPQLVSEVVERFGAQRVAAGLDVREGRVMLHGWTEASELGAVEAGRRMAETGLQTIIFTDIARDGVGSGINLTSALELAKQSGLEVIASGGVRGLEDIRQARQAGLAGVIVGHALYEGKFTLQEGLRISEHAG